MGEKKMAWELYSSKALLDQFAAIQMAVEIAEDAFDTTKRIADTGLVGVDEKQTAVPVGALEAPVLTVALNLVGFFSEALREPAKALAIKFMEQASIVPGEDPDFDDRLAQARRRVYHDDMLEALQAIGMTREEAEAEARTYESAGVGVEGVEGGDGSTPLH